MIIYHGIKDGKADVTIDGVRQLHDFEMPDPVILPAPQELNVADSVLKEFEEKMVEFYDIRQKMIRPTREQMEEHLHKYANGLIEIIFNASRLRLI
jgi:hypothetical protein